MYLEGFGFKSSPCRSLSVDIFLISLGTSVVLNLSVDIFLISLGTSVILNFVCGYIPWERVSLVPRLPRTSLGTRIGTSVILGHKSILLFVLNSCCEHAISLICLVHGFTVSKRVRYMAMQEFVSKNMPLC